MLKDLEQLLEWGERFGTQYPFIGFAVVGFAGGLIGTIKLYERAGFNMTLRMLLGRLAAKTIMGVFVGFLVYLGWRVVGGKVEYGYIGAAVCGIFSAEVLDVIFLSGVEFFRKRFGLMPAVPRAPVQAPSHGRPAEEER